MSSLSTWLSAWSPFRDDSGPSRVHSSGINEVEVPIHPEQRVEKVWTVTKNTDGNGGVAMNDLCISTPGLTVVSVDPKLQEQLGSDAIARVRVTSDKREHLDCVNVSATSKRNDCVVTFESKNGYKGNLVTEITIAEPDQLESILSIGGGDVVMHESVFSPSRPNSITDNAASDSIVTTASSSGVKQKNLKMAAMFGSRLFVSAPNTDIDVNSLWIASVGSSSVHFAARRLTAQHDVLAGVIGRGRVHIATQQFETKQTDLFSVGQDGVMLLTATERLQMNTFDSYVRGANSIDVAVPPDAVVACAKQSLRVSRGGHIDVADVQAQAATIKFRDRHGGNVEIRAPEIELTVKSKREAGVVGYLGDLPPVVRVENQSILVPMVATEPRARIQSESLLPNVVSAFESAVRLEAPSEGFWSGVVRPFLQF